MDDDALIGGRRTEDGGRPSDAELLRRYAATREEAAFAELVRRHVNLVYRAALRQLGGDAHRAQDATQVVFTVLARKAATLARHTSLTGWLYTTTHFSVSDLLRHERRRAARETEAHMIHEISKAEAGGAEWDRLRPVLDDVMQQLGERDRVALLARFFEGRTFGEIGGRLALSEDAARMRVERALEKLRALLARRGVTSTAAALGAMMAHEAAAAAPAGLAASVTGSALAGAAGVVASPLAGFIQFMSNTKLAAGLAGTLAILTLGMAVREVGARQDAEQAFAAVERDHRARLARRTSAEHEATTSEQEQGRLAREVEQARAALAARKTAAAAESTAAADSAPAWNPLEEGRAFLAKHPDAKAALVAWRRADFDARYESLYRSLGLKPEQVEEFRTLLLNSILTTRQFSGEMKYPMVLSAGDGPMTGVPPNDRLRALLGDDGYRQFEEIDRSMPARNLVTQVAQALCFTDTPLTVPQSAQLLQVAIGAQVPGRGRSPAKVNWDAVVANASGVLAVPQLAVLHDLRAREQASAALNAVNRAPNK